MKFLKIISYPLLTIFLAVNVCCFYNATLFAIGNYKTFKWLTIGIVAYILITKFFRKNLAYWRTFSHELTHKLVGLLFGRKIHSFTVTSEMGGAVHHSGKFSNNVLISLSPYCLPIYTYFLLIIRLMIENAYIWIFDIMIGLTVGFHAVAIFKDTQKCQQNVNQPKEYQPDIQKCGIFYSFLFIWAFLLFNAAIIIWSIPHGLNGAFVNWWDNFVIFFKFVKNILF
ncbi:MAG: M50 family metallopeptidase [Marinilabiliaceae bacterium]|nr:M50 family metallopeptidase [Marinilabiliaceae bacterium]